MKMQNLFVMLVVGVLVSACGGAAPVSVPAQSDAPFPQAGQIGTAAHVYPVESGWVDGQAVGYYNLGTNSPLNPDDATRVRVEKVYAFVTGFNADGTPITLPGQNNILSSKPGDALYSDLWQAHFVTPSADYVPNSLTTEDALVASGLVIEKQAVLVNCPFVPAGSSLADNAVKLTTGWVRGEAVTYFDFGQTNAQPGLVYAFITGFDAQGQPQLVAGQHFVFSAKRGTAEYSDFWQVQWVQVAAGYQADSIRAAGDIQAQDVKPAGILVNYPHKK